MSAVEEMERTAARAWKQSENSLTVRLKEYFLQLKGSASFLRPQSLAEKLRETALKNQEAIGVLIGMGVSYATVAIGGAAGGLIMKRFLPDKVDFGAALGAAAAAGLLAGSYYALQFYLRIIKDDHIQNEIDRFRR